MILGMALVSCAILALGQNIWWRGVGGVFLALAGYLGLLAWRFRSTPRLELHENELLVYVRSLGKPFRVPLDVVEVFFIGQGAVLGKETGHPREYNGAVAANVIVRLAESKASWHDRDVNQWLAVWAEGYITLRGLWCENIDQELLQTMNGALMTAKRKLRKGPAG